MCAPYVVSNGKEYLFHALLARLLPLALAITGFGARSVMALQTNWRGLDGAHWSIAGNWDNGVPDQYKDAYINNGNTCVVDTDDAECHSLYLGTDTEGLIPKRA